jgi:hypothetical protein
MGISVWKNMESVLYMLVVDKNVEFSKMMLQMVQNLSTVKGYYYYYYSYSGVWSPNWVHSARRPVIGLLYLPQVIVRMENLVE